MGKGKQQKIKHDCMKCGYPLSTNKRIIKVQTVTNGRKRMVSSPCPDCLANGKIVA